MKYATIFLTRLLLRLFYVFPVQKDKVIYLSYGGKKFNCNPKYVYRYLIDNTSKIRHVWVLVDPTNKDLNNETKQIENKGFTFIYNMLTAKVIISNASLPTYLPIRRKQRYIDTWHGGGAYKKTGVSYNRTPFQIKKLEWISEELDIFVSSSRIFTETKSENHLISKEKFFEVGMPRNDVLFKKNEAFIMKVKKYYNIDPETNIVLYAPTYRKEDDDASYYEWIDFQEVTRALEKKFGGKWVVMTRMHYYLDDKINFEHAINVSSYDDLQELLQAADVLITDYSSVMWDFSLTRKPCFVYAPDLEDYEKNRSFFTPPERWPFKIASSNEELAEAIEYFNQEEYNEAVRRHHSEQGSFETGTATEKVARKVLDYIEE